MYGPHWFRRLMAGVTVEEVQRFDGAFDVTRTELDRRCGNGESPWCDAARAEVDNATHHREAHKLEAAWSALKSAHREMVRSFEPSELVAEARIVRNEADAKLSGWRQDSVTDLLPDELLDSVGIITGGLTVERTIKTRTPSPAIEAPGTSPAAGQATEVDGQTSAETPAAERDADDAAPLVHDLRTRLITAKQMLDVHSDNVYHKFRILRRAVISTSVAIAVVLGILVALVALEWVPSILITEDSPLSSWRYLLVVMTFGTIGAFLSSATELGNRNEKVSIPELRVSYTLMGMRPIVGAMGATVVIVVLQSALGESVTIDSTAILGVAIAAGFTERLATRTITTAADALN